MSERPRTPDEIKAHLERIKEAMSAIRGVMGDVEQSTADGITDARLGMISSGARIVKSIADGTFAVVGNRVPPLKKAYEVIQDGIELIYAKDEAGRAAGVLKLGGAGEGPIGNASKGIGNAVDGFDKILEGDATGVAPIVQGFGDLAKSADELTGGKADFAPFDMVTGVGKAFGDLVDGNRRLVADSEQVDRIGEQGANAREAMLAQLERLQQRESELIEELGGRSQSGPGPEPQPEQFRATEPEETVSNQFSGESAAEAATEANQSSQSAAEAAREAQQHAEAAAEHAQAAEGRA